MTVEELIEVLETCEQDAEIMLDGGDINYLVATHAKETPNGAYVIIS